MARRLSKDINLAFVGLEAAQMAVASLGSPKDTMTSLEGAKKRAIKRLGFAFQSKWKQNLSGPASATRLGVRSGFLRRSIRLRFTHNKDRAEVYADSDYANIHEHGGVIRASRAPFLVFLGDFGHWVKTKQVHMPKRPHLEPTVKALKGRGQTYMNEEVSKAMAAVNVKVATLRKKRTDP
jgi:phage gpG-like protein